jgi:hypothetical protein
MINVSRCVGAFVVFLPVVVSAQKPVALGKPDAEFREPFVQISGVRELKDGRVLIADQRSRLVQIIDFKGSAINVGREGTGPGEFVSAAQVIALPGDTSAIYDSRQSRYLLVHPDGRPGKHFRLEFDLSQGAAARGTPRGVDAEGNIFFQGSSLSRTSDGGMTPAESAAVMRFTRRTGRVDTVAMVRLPKESASVNAGAGGGVQVSTGLGNPLWPGDDWVVLPDGRVAVVRAEPYRVEFFRSRTSKTVAVAVPYEKIKVDGSVRRMVEDQRQRMWRNAVSGGRGRNGAPTNTVVPRDPPPLPDEWPDVMPPFLARAAVARPNGQVWVARTQPPGNERALYDVFDDNGRVIGQVSLPSNTRLIGFGNGTAYLARSDDDDFLYIQRYRLVDIK